MARFALIVLVVALAALSPAGESPAPDNGSADPVFSHIPFDQWLSQGDQARMRWTARVLDAQLSPHQRLSARIFVQVDGGELAKRRGKGEFLVLVQINDEKGRAWQNHQAMDLEHVEAGMKANDAVFSQAVFVRPGDYRVSIAIFATATGEHSVIKRKLHVGALRNDPLPYAWRDLPAVEFIPVEMPPDNWYLPSIEGKLHLAVETREPAHVDLVVNLTPSERFTGSSRVQSRNMGALLPSVKVLSQVTWNNATFSLALLDLARHRVAWQQDDIRQQGIDWSHASVSLSEVNPGIIDVKSLEKRTHNAQFFLDEIRRRVRASKRAEAVIVLSSPVEFEPGQEMRPIALDGPSNARIYYIRYQPFPPIYFGRGAPRTRIQLPDGSPAPRGGFAATLDQLEPLLKPLEPRLFEVATPEQFRKALAAILAEIAAM